MCHLPQLGLRLEYMKRHQMVAAGCRGTGVSVQQERRGEPEGLGFSKRGFLEEAGLEPDLSIRSCLSCVSHAPRKM